MKTITKTKAKPQAGVKLRKKLVHIRLDPAIHQKADQLARADKRSFSQFVEVVLERYLSATQNDADTLAKEAFTATEHGFWSQIDAYEAAVNLQTMLPERQLCPLGIFNIRRLARFRGCE
ncbi:hypothetical protein U14_04736 [Candidatus Moduliflexus flocculans]|uniref:Uncharacterized protein n=1 Tax=Candidatus Moduliflexus flocculans TaxID=1499966 RepID=A0A0S6W4S7_9BACT|nr:hypothetical protein U14_04736 [Candidatus Moduliflexus flocculans]